MMEDLRRVMRTLRASQSELLSYVVLDHAVAPHVVERGRDRQGRVYVRCSPAILDEATHVKGRDPDLMGVPVYRRENMSPEWP